MTEFVFQNEVTDAYSEQTNCILRAFRGNDYVGDLAYTIYQSKPSISMINVLESERRKGIGRALMWQLQREFPGVEINWGLMTEDGLRLYESIPKTVVSTEFAPLFEELASAKITRDSLIGKAAAFHLLENVTEQQQLDHYEALLPMNDLHDRIYDLERELSGEKATKTLIMDAVKEIEMSKVPGNEMCMSVVFHGTTDTFLSGELRLASHGELGPGLYVSRDREVAHAYTKITEEVFDSVEAEKLAGVFDLNATALKFKELTKAQFLADRTFFFKYEEVVNNGEWDASCFDRAEAKLIQKYQREGFDGVYVDEERQGVVFPDRIVKLERCSVNDITVDPVAARVELIKQGCLSAEEIESALVDAEWRVRRAAVELGELSPVQMDRALNDVFYDVRQAAKVVESLMAARDLSDDAGKASCEIADKGCSQTYGGKVLGETSMHYVQNLGKSAVAHLKTGLSRMVAVGEMIDISYDGNRGVVMPRVRSMVLEK